MIIGALTKQQFKWRQPAVDVYFNPEDCRQDHDAVEQWIIDCCQSITIRSGQNYHYQGRVKTDRIAGHCVVSFMSADRISELAQTTAAGICRFSLERDTIISTRVYVRGKLAYELGEPYTRRLILHELWHSLGVIGHLPQGEQNVMSYVDMTKPIRVKPSLGDCQMLTLWEPKIVEMHWDGSLTVPCVEYNDQMLWVELEKVDESTWRPTLSIPWEGTSEPSAIIQGSAITMDNVVSRSYCGGMRFRVIEGDLLKRIGYY